MKFKIRQLFILRMNIFKHLLASILIICFTTVLNAQDQKNLLKQWGEGPIKEYAVKGTKGNYTYTDISSDQSDIELINMENPYNWGLKLKNNKGYNTYEFHADNNAHTVVLYVTKPRDKNLKYYMMDEETILRYRLCIIGNYIYLLERWNSKDDYRLKSIIEKKEAITASNKKSKFNKFKPKIMKDVSKIKGQNALNKKMSEVNHAEKLQAYLDKETSIQKQKTPAWNKKHAQYFADIAAEKKEYWKGDKEARVKLNRKLAEQYARDKRNGNSSSSSKSDGAGTVKVGISSGTRAKNFLKIYWKEGNSYKKKSVPSRSTSYINVPAGSKLYYTTDNEPESKKRFFMTAPTSGSGKYSF